MPQTGTCVGQWLLDGHEKANVFYPKNAKACDDKWFVSVGITLLGSMDLNRYVCNIIILITLSSISSGGVANLAIDKQRLFLSSPLAFSNDFRPGSTREARGSILRVGFPPLPHQRCATGPARTHRQKTSIARIRNDEEEAAEAHPEAFSKVTAEDWLSWATTPDAVRLIARGLC